MLTKPILATIVIAAFLYALYLLIRKKPFAFQHPSATAPETLRRPRYLFYLATLIFLGGFGAFLVHANKREISVASTEGGVAVAAAPATAADNARGRDLARYEAEARKKLAKMSLRDALKLAWRTLNTAALPSGQPIYAGDEGGQGYERATAFFKVSLEKAMQEGVISAQAATILQQTHAKLAYDFFMLHSRSTCYAETMELPVQQSDVLEALKQRLDLLCHAQKEGTLSPAVIAKLTKALRIELQTLTDIDHIDQTTKSGDFNDQLQKLTKLAEAIKNESLAISPVTEEAVQFLLQLEGVSPTDAPPAPASPNESAPLR